MACFHGMFYIFMIPMHRGLSAQLFLLSGKIRLLLIQNSKTNYIILHDMVFRLQMWRSLTYIVFLKLCLTKYNSLVFLDGQTWRSLHLYMDKDL